MRGWIILISRVFYAMSWFYLSPILPLLSRELNFPISLAGLVAASFFLGAGSMQLPSAYLSTRLGTKRTLSLGLIVMGVANLFVSQSNSFIELLLAYSIVGVGASMFFSSGGGLLSYLNSRASTVLGLYNGLFSVGGILAFLYGDIEISLGWRWPVAALGLLTLALGIITMRSSLPNPAGKWGTVKDPRVLILGLGTSGVWGAYFALGNLYPTFASTFQGVQLSFASTLSSLLLVSSALGGFLGFLGDRVKGMGILLLPSIASMVSILILYVNSVAGLILTGLFNELAISIMYARAASAVGYLNASISLAEVNSINMLCGIYLAPLASLFGPRMLFLLSGLGLIPLSLLALYSSAERRMEGRSSHL
jgi:ACDE family multidrug resistance protein